jgi:hypothetical protein
MSKPQAGRIVLPNGAEIRVKAFSPNGEQVSQMEDFGHVESGVVTDPKELGELFTKLIESLGRVGVKSSCHYDGYYHAVGEDRED